MDKPSAIAVDPVAGFLFWADRGRIPKIERARLDGSERRTLVSESIVFTTGLTLDYERKSVYWCDSRLDTIERMDYNGENRVTLLDSKSNLENPQGIAVYGESLFWIDTTSDGGTLNQAPISNVSGYQSILAQLGESLKDLKVMSKGKYTKKAKARLCRVFIADVSRFGRFIAPIDKQAQTLVLLETVAARNCACTTGPAPCALVPTDKSALTGATARNSTRLSFTPG